MRGLDDWITGRYDPNAPFNREDVLTFGDLEEGDEFLYGGETYKKVTPLQALCHLDHLHTFNLFENVEEVNE